MKKFQEQVVQVLKAIPDSGAEVASKLIAMCNDLTKQYDMRFDMNCDYGGRIRVAVDHGTDSSGEWVSFIIWVLTNDKYMVMLEGRKDSHGEKIGVCFDDRRSSRLSTFYHNLIAYLHVVRAQVPSLTEHIGALNQQQCIEDLRLYGTDW